MILLTVLCLKYPFLHYEDNNSLQQVSLYDSVLPNEQQRRKNSIKLCAISLNDYR